MAEYSSRIEGIQDGGVVNNIVNVLGVNSKVPQSVIEQQLIDGGGDDGYKALFQELIDGSISGEISDDEITKIRTYAFYNCTNLQKASFPLVKLIGSYAFYSCTQLQEASFPIADSIASYAFYSCTQLQEASFPLVESIGSNTFYNCTQLKKVSFPLATSIGTHAFRGCTQLQEVSLPLVDSIPSNAFYDCTHLQEASFPLVESIGTYAFSGCAAMESITLGVNKVCTLSNTNAFNNTQIKLGTGKIYVPANLVDQYKSTSNWSTYASHIEAIPA